MNYLDKAVFCTNNAMLVALDLEEKPQKSKFVALQEDNDRQRSVRS